MCVCLHDMNLDYIAVWELGSDLLSGLCKQRYLQTNVCVWIYKSFMRRRHVSSFTSRHSHVNTSNLLWEHCCFLPYTFPLIPPATNVGSNYHQSIWLLIIQHMKKSWPCVSCYSRPRANSTECVTWLQITVCIKTEGWNAHIPHFTHWLHRCNMCVFARILYLHDTAANRKLIGSAKPNKKEK